ncbi:hypothetical protein MFLAVUS_010584 [Mucor flavus]|uniref:Uncharacterized protein n=1 Tax=Mucor flavus TaxID=439312 RepID=A0ABP9ZD52_9FUNG
MVTKANTQFDGIRLSNQHLLYPFDEHAHLRQVRSKFDRLSTYLCYQLSSKCTNDVRTRSWKVWTIADRSRNQDRDSSGVAVSKLFKHVTTQVWDNGAEASLTLNIVTFFETSMNILMKNCQKKKNVLNESYLSQNIILDWKYELALKDLIDKNLLMKPTEENMKELGNIYLQEVSKVYKSRRKGCKHVYGPVFDNAFIYDKNFITKRADCISNITKEFDDIANQRISFILRG